MNINKYILNILFFRNQLYLLVIFKPKLISYEETITDDCLVCVCRSHDLVRADKSNFGFGEKVINN